jgi:hypothetical protein
MMKVKKNTKYWLGNLKRRWGLLVRCGHKWELILDKWGV